MIEEEREGRLGRLGVYRVQKDTKKYFIFIANTASEMAGQLEGRGEQKVKLSSSNNIRTIRRATGLRSIEEPEAYTPAGGGFGFGVA